MSTYSLLKEIGTWIVMCVFACVYIKYFKSFHNYSVQQYKQRPNKTIQNKETKQFKTKKQNSSIIILSSRTSVIHINFTKFYIIFYPSSQV